MKDALASGKFLPTELKKDAKNLGKELAFDEAQAGEMYSNFSGCPEVVLTLLHSLRSNDPH